MKKKSFVVIVILLITIILGLCAYIAYDKGLFDNKKENKKETKTVEKKEKSIKIYETKDYIYDADYVYNKINDYNNLSGEILYTYEGLNIVMENSEGSMYNNIRVPYINIKTEEVKKINNDINKLFTEYSKKLDESLNYHKNNPDEIFAREFINYKVFSNKKTISLIIVFGDIGSDVPVPNYIAYTFDLNTGKILNITDIEKIKSIDSNKLNDMAKDAIKNAVAEEDKKYPGNYMLNETLNYLDKNISKLGNITYNNIDYKGLIYYLDDNNNINLLTKFYTQSGHGFTVKNLTLK